MLGDYRMCNVFNAGLKLLRISGFPLSKTSASVFRFLQNNQSMYFLKFWKPKGLNGVHDGQGILLTIFPQLLALCIGLTGQAKTC